MLSTRSPIPDKPHRLPRKGLLFVLVRFAGLLFKVAGLLLLGTAVTGFFVMLLRIGPTFVGSIHYSEQKIAGFTFLISLAYLLVFPIIGLVGAAMAGIGFVLGRMGTEPITSTTIIGPDQA
jgi:hypothetical protein